jgi:hypothetical protein
VSAELGPVTIFTLNDGVLAVRNYVVSESFMHIFPPRVSLLAPGRGSPILAWTEEGHVFLSVNIRKYAPWKLFRSYCDDFQAR